jgi:hypothetical protein
MQLKCPSSHYPVSSHYAYHADLIALRKVSNKILDYYFCQLCLELVRFAISVAYVVLFAKKSRIHVKVGPLDRSMC